MSGENNFEKQSQTTVITVIHLFFTLFLLVSLILFALSVRLSVLLSLRNTHTMTRRPRKTRLVSLCQKTKKPLPLCRQGRRGGARVIVSERSPIRHCQRGGRQCPPSCSLHHSLARGFLRLYCAPQYACAPPLPRALH